MIFQSIFLFLISIVYAYKNEYAQKYDIELKIKTSECQRAGTDGPLYIYFVDNGKTPFKFIKHSGPFQLYTTHQKYDKAMFSAQTLKWSTITETIIDSLKNSLPKLDIIIIEKSYYNAVVPNLFSAWKPLSIKISVKPHSNQTALISNTFNFASNCNSGWIDENVFYQIGPLQGQLQNLGSQYDDIFE